MNYGIVTYGHIWADVSGKFFICNVNDGVILNIRPFTNTDVINVSPYDCVVPHARIFADHDITDNMNIWYFETARLCKLYDFNNKRWLDFSGKPTSDSLAQAA